MSKVVKPIHHDCEEAVSVVRRRLMLLLKGYYLFRCERRTLGIPSSALTCQEEQAIREVSKNWVYRQVENNLPRLCAWRVKQSHQEKPAGSLGTITNIGRVAALMLLIFIRPHVTVGTSDKAAQHGSLFTAIGEHEKGVTVTEQAGERLDGTLRTFRFRQGS